MSKAKKKKEARKLKLANLKEQSIEEDINAVGNGNKKVSNKTKPRISDDEGSTKEGHENNIPNGLETKKSKTKNKGKQKLNKQEQKTENSVGNKKINQQGKLTSNKQQKLKKDELAEGTNNKPQKTGNKKLYNQKQASASNLDSAVIQATKKVTRSSGGKQKPNGVKGSKPSDNQEQQEASGSSLASAVIQTTKKATRSSTGKHKPNGDKGCKPFEENNGVKGSKPSDNKGTEGREKFELKMIHITPQFKKKVASSRPAKPTKPKMTRRRKLEKPLPPKNLVRCFGFAIEDHDEDLSMVDTVLPHSSLENEAHETNEEISDDNETKEDTSATDDTLLVDPGLEGFDMQRKVNISFIGDTSSSSEESSDEEKDETPNKVDNKDGKGVLQSSSGSNQVEGSTNAGASKDFDNDSDIEILDEFFGSATNTGAGVSVENVIKKEIKEEKPLDLLQSVSKTEVKHEYEQQLSRQNRKINFMEKTLKVLVDKLVNKEHVDLKDLSKIIDSKNPSNTIMPEVIEIPDGDLDDEVLPFPPSCPDSSALAPSSLDSSAFAPPTPDSSALALTRKRKLLSSESKRIKIHKANDLLYSPGNQLIDLADSESENVVKINASCSVTDCDHIACNLPNQDETHSGGLSSKLGARTAELNNYQTYGRAPRSTGIQSHASLDWSKNPNVPEDFWIKHTWADKTNTMCDPSELDEYISSHNLEHIADEIAYWFCTAWPINLYDRRYWSYKHDDGTVWVSRTLAQSKNFVLRGKPVDPLDRCVICMKLLVTEYHVYMPVFQFQENPPKALIWKWQNSREKACYIHFQSSKCEWVPNRNPNKLDSKKGSNKPWQFQEQRRLPAPKVRQSDVGVPDDF